MTLPEHNEAALSDYFERYVAAGKPGGLAFARRHPRATLAALRHLRALPEVGFAVSASTEGAIVDRAVRNRPGWSLLRPAVTTLAIPADPAEYTDGSSKQTLRRKVRASGKAGVTWRAVDDPAERRRLLVRADDYERTEARQGYRNADADNSELLDVRLWLGAFKDGEPLMLSITPHDLDWASLSYFRTFSADPAASDARYLMTQVLVEHLAERGVRRLADTVHPIHLPNGLRHFQRMVGYRIERVSLDAPPAEAPAASSPVGALRHG